MTNVKRMGRCINHRRCALADSSSPIPVDAGAPFVCPECQRDLTPHEGKAKKIDAGEPIRGVPKMLLWPAILLVTLVAIGLYFGLFRRLQSFDLKEIPPNPSIGELAYSPPSFVRAGTSAVTYDRLAPELWRAFLVNNGCPKPVVEVGEVKTKIHCSDSSHPTTITISAPNSLTGVARRAMKNFDVLLTTDAIANPPELSAGPGANKPHAASTDAPPVHGQVIAIDALAVIVNPANPLARLSVRQLADVFLGLTRDFSAVGGRPGAIHVVAPRGTPASDDRLRAIVPEWLPLAVGAQRLSTSAAIAEAVMADRNAIGLVEADTTGGARVLAIGPGAGVASLPTSLAQISGDYPLARPLYAYRFNRDDSLFETAFIDFAQSRTGQMAVAAAGFTPHRIEIFAAARPRPIPAEYARRIDGADRVAANLHFADDGETILPRSRDDLDRVAARLIGDRIAAERITVIGFADPAAGAAALRQSEAVARRIATALGERRLEVGGSTGMGGAMPIAEAGNGANRRAEIWVRRN